MSAEQGQQDICIKSTDTRSNSVRVHPSVTKDLRDLGYTGVEYESDLPREIVATYVGFKPETQEILHRYGIRVVKHSTYDYCGIRKPGYTPCSFPSQHGVLTHKSCVSRQKKKRSVESSTTS